MHRPKHIAVAACTAIALGLTGAACDGGGRALGPRTVSETTSGDTTIATLQVDPTVPQLIRIDDVHEVLISANAICAVATSSYGPTEWDQPCTPETAPVTMTARSSVDSAGNPRVDFTPALRFNPAADPVKIYMKAPSSNLSGVVILYCPESGPCVDESLTDSKLETFRDKNDRSLYYRRIKHFSGYWVTTGYTDGAAAL